MNNLTKEQKKAAEYLGNKVIIAGAGAGKTSTIISDVENKVFNLGVNPSQIVMISHTNTAANEMKERLSKKGIPVDKVMTIHSFSRRYLVRHINNKDRYAPIDESTEDKKPIFNKDVNSINRVVVDKSKKVTRMDFIYEALFEEVYTVLLKKGWDLNNFKVCEIAKYVSSICNEIANLVSLHKIKANDLVERKLHKLNKGYPTEDGILITIHIEVFPDISISEIAYKYDKLKQCKYNKHYFDYDDLLVWGIRQMSRNPKLVSGIKYIYIDEFQDVDAIQNEMVDLFLIGGLNVTLIGDPMQSIYGFKGASPNFILSRLNSSQFDSFHLPHNFRSCQSIVEFANCINEYNMGVNNKMIHVIEDKSHKPIIELKFRDKEQYISNYTNLICEVVDNGVPPKDIAFLRWSIDGKSFNIEEMQISLLRRGIVSKCSSSKTLFSDPYSSLLLSVFDYIVNERKDMDTFILNQIKFIRGIDDKNANEILSTVSTGLFEDTPYGLFENWVKIQSKRNTVKSLYARLLYNVTVFIRNTKNNNFSNFSELFYHVTREIKTKFNNEDFNIYKLSSDTKTKYTGCERDIVNFEHLLNHYLDTHGDNMDLIKLESLFDNDNCLTFSTIHSAKGLEWDCVILDNPLKEDLKSENIDEVERLKYVGVTRAKKLLYINNY